MKSRIVIIFTVLLSLWIVVLTRAAFIQIIPNEKLAKLQKRQFETIVTLQSRRGAMTDRHGKELAVTISSYSLYADPQIIAEPKAVSKKLSRLLNLNEKRLLKKLSNSKRRFSWIRRNLTEEVMIQVKRLKVRGLAFINEPQRVYPNDELLSQAMGFIGIDSQGLEGLELEYDDILRGSNKKVNLQRDARGRPLVVNGRMFSQNPEGSHIELTIDSELQYILERTLGETVDKFDAQSGMGIVLDAQTSEILAMANVPLYNLNKARLYTGEVRRIRTITDSFEPGSTFKTFVVAAGLKTKTLMPNKKYFCENGKFDVGDKTIHEADSRHSFGWLSVSEILVHSSNIGTTKIGFDVGAEKLRSSLEEFGFGNRTGVDLPGEVRGSLQKLPWRPHLLSNVSFGHGVSTTPLQMAAAYAAIANGGELKKPYIVKSIYNTEEKEKYEFKENVVRRVLSEEHADMLKMMLLQAAAPKSRISGFPVAGKTGTAQKVRADGRGYLKGEYISSYAGFVPAHAPKYVIYIAVDQPQKKYYGADIAAPVFAKVANFAVRKAGLTPVLISQKDVMEQKIKSKSKKDILKLAQEKQRENDAHITPHLEGMGLRDVYNRVRGTEVQLRVYGRGRVVRTIPEAGTELPLNKTIQVYLKEN